MSTKFTILVIEDEKHIGVAITKLLQSNGYRAMNAYSGAEALSLITSQCPDIILLDLGLPDMDGMEILKQIRSWFSNPVIVVSARTHESDKVEALDAGADDYIAKPFGPSELMARIRTSLRHSNRLSTQVGHHQRPYIAKGLHIDFLKRSIVLDGKELHLTPVEYKILTFLAKNAGKVMTYSSIMKNVWGPYAESDNKILRVNMANIRRKIEQSPAEPIYIYTEVGIGYRLLEEDPL